MWLVRRSPSWLCLRYRAFGRGTRNLNSVITAPFVALKIRTIPSEPGGDESGKWHLNATSESADSGTAARAIS